MPKHPNSTTTTAVIPTQNSLNHALFKPMHPTSASVPNSAKKGGNTCFKNPWPIEEKRRTSAYSALRSQRYGKWPRWVDNPPIPYKPQARPHALLSDWKIWFVGHATVLIQIGSYHFLTDPVWAERVSPLASLGPKRVRAAGIALQDLPPIDAILLSHNHYDHMDMASLTWIHERDQPLIYTGLGNAQYLPKAFNVVELDWWQEVVFAPNAAIRIVFTPAQHFSGRGLRDRNVALWGGLSVITGGDHLFFAGDTGYAPHFKEIFERLGAPRMALLPIGAYEPRALFKWMHMNPHDAVQAHLDLNSKKSLGIHYHTFQLTFEAMNQPLLDLASALQQQTSAAPFITLLEGDVCDC